VAKLLLGGFAGAALGGQRGHRLLMRQFGVPALGLRLAQRRLRLPQLPGQ
jgi:hypothetical protein